MAKNAARKTKPNASKASASKTNNSSAEAAAKKRSESKPVKKKDVLYQIKTKKTSDIIKSYITFTYRVFHPAVTTRLIFYGVLVMLPGFFYFKDVFWKAFFIGIGAALVLLAFFRQYISLAITKRNDPDYKSGAVFTYDFNDIGAEFLKDDEVFARLDRYKDITNFYYDENNFYLAIRSREVFVIPKSCFTIGDPEGFEEFIYKKSKHSCRWIPNKLSDRMKKRRAQRAVMSETNMNKK